MAHLSGSQQDPPVTGGIAARLHMTGRRVPSPTRSGRGHRAQWPHVGFTATPSSRVSRALARRIRDAVMGGGHDRGLDLAALCRSGRFDVEEVRLHGAEGRLQGLLFPAPHNRFDILVDPEPPGGWDAIHPSMRRPLRDHRMRFRICHEVAHTFFFNRSGSAPQPLVPGSPGQERFCDSFAGLLLVPWEACAEAPVTARGVLDLQERFDVSLEVAARAFAAVHRDVEVALYTLSPDGGEAVQWTNRRRGDHAAERELKPGWRGTARGRCVAQLADRRQALVVRS
jgi:hypothetical protein